VRGPTGVDWTVSRDWFGLPRWTRFEGEWPVANVPPDAGLGGVDASGLAAIALFVLVVLVLALMLWLFLPLVLFIAGLLVATAGLAARLLRLSAWTVRARGGDRVLEWRIVGTRGSGRAMRQLARRLELGQEPTIDGVAGLHEAL
jgi:hypothetical protein